MADAARISVETHPARRFIRAGDQALPAAPKASAHEDFARVAAELISTAERDSVRIVASANAEIHQTILRSEHELHVLATQTQAMLDLLQARELDARISRRSHPRSAEFPDSARHVLSTLMEQSRAELATLSSQAEPLTPLTRFDIPEAVPIEAVPILEPLRRERFAVKLARRLASHRRLRAGVSAAAILTLASIGFWWALQPSDRGQLQEGEQPVATAGGAPAAMKVDIEVRRPVWIRFGVDGRSDAGRVFQTGEKRRITAAQEVSIRAGDAGAVFMSVNGGRAAALGGDGQVITRRVRLPEVAAVGSSTGRGDDDRERPKASSAAPSTAEARQETPATASAATSPSPASSSSPSPEAPGALTGNAPPAVRSQIMAAAQRWLQAYHLGDRDLMAAASTSGIAITDERTATERLAGGLPGVQRTLDEAAVQVFGSDALLSAKMVERSGGHQADQAAESVAFVSQLWTRQASEWKLAQVRIVSAAALERMTRGK